MSHRKKLIKLEESNVWRQAEYVAEKVRAIYDQLDDDDKTIFRWRFYARAYDLTADVAEAVGSIESKDVEFGLAQARRALFGVKSSYKYLTALGTISLDPDYMTKLDRLLDEIDQLLGKAWQEMDELDKKDIKK